MTKGDMYTKQILNRILEEGTLNKNQRTHYKDGTPAYAMSVNHGMCEYDLTKGESPLITLRPIACKSAIGEILWIYQDQSTDLDLLKEKYNVTWWDEWDIGDRTIGSTYGKIVKDYDLMNKLLDGLRNNPDSRYHIIDLWQEEEFSKKHGLKPCAFLTQWNVRYGKDGNTYLDMCLTQRSSDFSTAGCINQVQYLSLLYMVAAHVHMKPGRFTWFYNNIQIYDRHLDQARELISRDSVPCNPRIELNPDIDNFYDFTLNDVKIVDYPVQKIKEKNKQLKFEIAI